MNAPVYRWDGPVLELRVRARPRAQRDEIVGINEGAVAVRLKAPPADGLANQSLIAVLAKAFDVPKSQVVLKRGQSSRLKTLRIDAPRRIPEVLRADLSRSPG